jgi:hypothetical protein
MGVVNFGINKQLVQRLLEVYPINNFVETGTYLGGTSYWASTLFKEVHTIEISDELYQQAKSKYSHVKNLHFHLGDSKDILPGIVKQLDGPAVFWLDGHWCGRNTGGKYNPCPIMDELECATSVKDSVILIDDFRYFLGPNPNDFGENYPSLQSIFAFLNERLPDHYITFHDDTIICVPNKGRESVDKDWLENYSKRYPQTLKSISSKLWWRIRNLNFKREYKK